QGSLERFHASPQHVRQNTVDLQQGAVDGVGVAQAQTAGRRQPEHDRRSLVLAQHQRRQPEARTEAVAAADAPLALDGDPEALLVRPRAARAAGPAWVVAWAALLVRRGPRAVTFAALGVRHPVAGGVSAYVREAFGESAAAVTGVWFMTAVLFGGPAVALIGG